MIEILQGATNKANVRPLFFFRPPPHAVSSLPPAPSLPLPASACRHLPTRALRICISPSHPTRRTLFLLHLTSFMNFHYMYSARKAATSTTCSRIRTHTARPLASGATGLRTRKGTASRAQRLGTVPRRASLHHARYVSFSYEIHHVQVNSNAIL